MSTKRSIAETTTSVMRMSSIEIAEAFAKLKM
jgi:hypothetical protein